MAEIKRILVANRGEIALRAIRTIKEMGKEAVAIYSTADKGSEYLKLADASICVGAGPSSQSYLNIPSIISAAEISGCDAVFPGYGFLSENAGFASVCESCGLTFIGPEPGVIAAATLSVVRHAATGKPLPIPLADVTISGTIPACS